MAYPERLAGAAFEVLIPTSLAERYDLALAHAGGAARPRVLAAAVGVCWPRIRRRIPYTGDVLAFGGAVIEELCKPGPDAVRVTELVRVGAEVMTELYLSLPEIAEAAPFVEAPAPAGGALEGGS